MDGLLTRKQFFREIACKTAQLTIDVMTPVLETHGPIQTLDDNSMAADLTPEFLEQEAKRLGLDPNDPQQVLNQLSASLQRSGD
jgi:hypothetical protein